MLTRVLRATIENFPQHLLFSLFIKRPIPSIPISTQHKSFLLPHSYPTLGEKNEAMADDTPEDKKIRERIFRRFDENSDGKISAKELKEALKALGSVSAEEVARMMGEIDTDGDGFISFAEFTAFALANRGLMKDVAKIF